MQLASLARVFTKTRGLEEEARCVCFLSGEFCFLEDKTNCLMPIMREVEVEKKMNQQQLTGSELLLGVGVAAGAVWLARNPELIVGFVSGAAKISSMKNWRMHNTEKFDQEILNRWWTLQPDQFKRYVQFFNLTEIERQRLATRMSNALVKKGGVDRCDEVLRFLLALSPPSLTSQSAKPASRARKRRRAARLRTAYHSSDSFRLPEPEPFSMSERNTLQPSLISLVNRHEVETTNVQIVDVLAESSCADLLRAIETKLLAQDPPPTRKEARAFFKPVIDSCSRRPKPVKQKKESRFDQRKIERLLSEWHAEIIRRSGTGPAVIRRSKDRINVEIPTWTGWVKAEFPEECLNLTGDALKGFTREVKREVYRLSDRRLGEGQQS